LSRLALKIVVMTREQGAGKRERGTAKRFWVTLLFVTYVGFFRSPTYLLLMIKYQDLPSLIIKSSSCYSKSIN
ncbi:MAG: hypothetical protein ACKPGB_30795, partial [Dolichospermum sp.]